MLIANFHSRTQHLDVTEFFTHQLMHNFFKGSIKIYIKIAPTCFGVITIIRERTINHNSKKKKLRDLSPRANYTDRAAAAGRRS